MIATSKQKQVFSIILISILIAVILVGMGIGIYFIVNKDSEGLLSVKKRNFGNEVNRVSSTQNVSTIDASFLPEEINVEDVVIYTEDYVVLKSKTSVYEIFSIKQNIKLDLSSLGEYDSISAIYGNVAVVNSGNQSSLINLSNISILVTLQNNKLTYSNGYLIIKDFSSVGTALLSAQQTDVLLCVVDCKYCNVVYQVEKSDNCIDLNICDGFAVVSFVDKTEIVNLANGASVVKSMVNQGNEIAVSSSNISSFVNNQSYFMNDYHKVGCLGNGRFLIERALVVEGDNYDISSMLEDDSVHNYKISYSIYDANNNVELVLESNGLIYRELKTALGSDYIALISSEIVNRSSVASSKNITYYLYEVGKKGISIEKLISYDYSLYGEIVGFDGEKLLTSGGTNSSVIDFEGKKVELSSSEYSLASTSYDKAYIVSNDLGEKLLLDKNGKALVTGTFTKVTPFINGYALAYDGQYYYSISNTGIKTKLVDFAEEFNQYVFTGIGYYFTKDVSSYNVYKVDGQLAYENASVSLVYESCTKMVVLNILSGNSKIILKVQPLLTNQLLELGQEEQFSNEKEFASVYNFGKTVIETSDTIVGETTIIHEESGKAKITYANINLLDGEFEAYADIVASEKLAMIPHLDEDDRYLDGDSVGYTINGVRYITGDYIALAVIRLSKDGDEAGKYYYLVTVAISNVYLSSVTATDSASQNLIYELDDSVKTASGEVSSPIYSEALNGSALLYGESSGSGRIVDYVSAGYQGGFVLTSSQTDSLVLSLVLSNTYDGNVSTDGELENMEGASADHDKFSTEVLTGNILRITAKEGYLLKGFTLLEDVTSDSTYVATDLKQTTRSGLTVSYYEITLDDNCEYFKLSNVEIIERYSYFNLKDYDGSDIGRVYYFDGGEGESSLGFSEFEKTTSLTSLPERIGYEFIGYTYNGNEVIDQNGILVADAGLFVVENQNEIATFDLVANYSPKIYTIYYSSVGTVLTTTTEVTYDSVVTGLYDIVNSEYNRIGYTFNGWYSSDTFDDDTKFVEGTTMYNVAESITLYAKWTANVLSLTFDSNIANYTNVSVGGYTYYIDKVTIGGVDFVSSTKEITFDEKYGAMPSLVAVDSRDVLNPINYTFIGWFENATIDSKGNKISAEDTVNVTDDLTLYAHYTRDVYYVDIKVSGEKNAMDGESYLDYLENLSYLGSDSNGVKLDTEKSTATGFWSAVDGAYKMYTICGENLELKAFTGTGYFVSEITITKYNNSGDKTEHIVTGSYVGGEYSLNGSVTNVTITNDGFDLTLIFDNILEGYQGQYADVEITYSSITYTNSISVNDTDNVTVTGTGLSLSGNVYTQSVVYGVKNEFALNAASVLNRDGDEIFTTYIKQITIDETIIPFTIEYAIDERRSTYSYNLITDFENCSVSWSGNKRQQLIQVGSVDLYIEYEAGLFSYDLYIVNNEDHGIVIEFEDFGTVSANLSLNNASQVSIDGFYYEKDGTGEVEIGTSIEMNKYGLVEWLVRPNDNAFIYELNVTYSGINFEMAIPSMPYLNIANNNINQDVNYFANEAFESASSTKKKMLGANVQIEWVKESRAFKFIVTDIAYDLNIEVKTMQYNLVTIISPVTDDDSMFDVLVANNGGAYRNISYSEVTSTERNVKTEGVYKTHNSSTGIFSYVIVGENADISKIKIDVPNNGEEAYVINAGQSYPEASSDFNLETTSVEFNRSLVNTKIYMSAYTGRLSMESYVGVGGDNYELDPRSGYVLQTNLEAMYTNTHSVASTVKYSGSSDVTEFRNNKFTFKLYDIKGYYFNNEAYIKAGEDEQVLINGDYDSSEKCWTFEYTVEDLGQTEFKFIVYQKAIEYTVQYEANTANLLEGSVVSGSTNNSLHVYNVSSNLSDNGMTITGYIFIGYSLTADITDGVIDKEDEKINFAMPEEQLLTENLTDEDEKVITLYAVFKLEKYVVTLDLNDEEGSTQAECEHESIEVLFGGQFSMLPDVERAGYTFEGWYISKASSSIKINNADSLTDAYLDMIPLAENTFTLYAKYTAKMYTFNINKNDKMSGFGSSLSSGVDQITVKFDKEFTAEFTAQTRNGYSFLGYKAIMLNGETAMTDTSQYIGLGTESISLIDKNFLDSAADLGLTINHESCTIDYLYAVWTPLTYKVLINLNLYDLYVYGREEVDCQATLTFNETSLNTSLSYISEDIYTFNVEFDKAIGENKLPEVELKGFNFKGFYSEKASGTILNAETILSNELFETLTLVNSEDGETVSLTADLSIQEFSIYGQYEELNYEFNVTISEENTGKPDIEVVRFGETHVENDVCNETNKVEDVHYGDDVVLDIFTVVGKYINELTLTYVGEDGNSQTIRIEFAWNNLKLIDKANGFELTVGEFIEIQGDISYITDSIKVKFIEYGVGVEDACRIVVKVESVKTSFDASVQADWQTYEIQRHAYMYNPDGLTYVEQALPLSERVETKTIEYGYMVTDADLEHDFRAMFEFEQWNYGWIDGALATPITTKVNVDDEITENKIMVAKYKLVEMQGIEFYCYDGSGYTLVETYDLYKLEAGGAVDGDAIAFFTLNRLTSFPSPANQLWPENTVLSGYVIANSAPIGGGYYSHGVNTAGLTEFNSSVKLEGMISVYAVYNEQKFTLTTTTSGGVTTGSITLDVYDILPNGEAFRYDYSDVCYIAMSDSQYESYIRTIEDYDESKEVALRKAIGDYSSAQYIFTDNSSVELGVSGQYYVAFILKEAEDGSKYVFIVSDVANA